MPPAVRLRPRVTITKSDMERSISDFVISISDFVRPKTDSVRKTDAQCHIRFACRNEMLPPVWLNFFACSLKNMV